MSERAPVVDGSGGSPLLSRRLLLAIFVLAVLVRVAYVLLLRPKVLGVSDAQAFRLMGQNLADGHGYIQPIDWLYFKRSLPTAEYGPLHPALLALSTLGGAGSVLAQQLALSVVGALTPVLTALLAARITRSVRVASVAGVVAGTHPLLFGSDGALMSETLYTALAMAAVLALVRAAQEDSLRWAALAGGAVGFSVLTRGDGLLLLPFVALPVLLFPRRRIDRRVLLQGGVVVGVVLLVVLPWVARNAARFDGKPVLSNNLGSLLNGSNCPESYGGRGLGSWNFRCAYRLELTGKNEAENAELLRKAGIGYLREHVDRLPVVVPARVGRAWGVYRPLAQARAEVDEARVYGTQVAGVVLDWALLPLAAVGLVALRRRRMPLSPVLGPLLMVTLLVAATYGNSRFRTVAEPALIIAASAVLLLFQGRPAPDTSAWAPAPCRTTKHELWFDGGTRGSGTTAICRSSTSCARSPSSGTPAWGPSA